MKLEFSNLRRILVIGDAMLDVHHRGECSRISPEAPVPIVNMPVNGVETRLGAAANVAAHIVSADIDCLFAYKAFDEPSSFNTHEQLENMCNAQGITCVPLHMPNRIFTVTIKERIWAGTQQVCRLDKEDRTPPDKELELQWLLSIRELLTKYNIRCVILSDYDKGTLTDSLIQAIAIECCQRQIPVILDPKRPTFPRLRRLTLIKPNRREIIATNSTPEEISDSLQNTYLVNTIGKDGMVVYQAGSQLLTLPTMAESTEVVDVCGCGDTVNALFGIMLFHGRPINEVVEAGSRAAAISIRHRGCYVPTKEEMKKILSLYV